MENSPPGIHTILVEPVAAGRVGCEAFSTVGRKGGGRAVTSSGELAEALGGELPTASSDGGVAGLADAEARGDANACPRLQPAASSSPHHPVDALARIRSKDKTRNISGTLEPRSAVSSGRVSTWRGRGSFPAPLDHDHGCAASQSITPLYLGAAVSASPVLALRPQHAPVCVYCMKGPVSLAPEMPSRYCV